MPLKMTFNRASAQTHLPNKEGLYYMNTGQTRFIRQLGEFVLRYVCLPNIPFLVLGNFIYFDRPLINLDYIVLGLLAPLLSRGINLVLFFIWLLADLFVSTTSVFRLPISDFIRATGSVTQLSFLVLAPLLLPILLLILVLVKCATFFKTSRNYGSAGPGTILLMVFLLTNATGAGSWLKIHLGLHGGKFSDSTIWRFAYAAAMDFETPNLDKSNFWTVNSATSEVEAELNADLASLPNKVVLVLVESWGYSAASPISSHIEAPLFSEPIRNRYQVRKGTVPFEGSTVNAEMRELCGIRGGFRESRLDGDTLSVCLPAKFSRAGYATTAIHGFTKSMFNRQSWYPNVGFENQFFKDNWPENISSRLCGSLFVGICDVDAAKLLRHELLTGPSKHFIYWLTLDSHLQFDGKSQSKCGEGIPELLCNLAMSLQNVTSAIAEIALDPNVPPTRFTIVGDHAPPILNPGLRRQFSDSEVPFIELIPR
jgi:hypothetical protein